MTSASAGRDPVSPQSPAASCFVVTLRNKCSPPRFHPLRGFPDGSDSKESACNPGDPRLDPWVGNIPWRREWHPTLVFLPEESRERTWQIMVHGVAESDTAEQPTLLLARFGASPVAQR